MGNHGKNNGELLPSYNTLSAVLPIHIDLDILSSRLQTVCGCPMLFAAHGAGVESNPLRNLAWAGSFRQQPAAWTLLPTNRDAFGYDWQMIGYQNGLAALKALAINGRGHYSWPLTAGVIH